MLQNGTLEPQIRITCPSNLMFIFIYNVCCIIYKLYYFTCFSSVIPATENNPINVRKMSDHQFPSLSLIDKNKTNGLVKISYLTI